MYRAAPPYFDRLIDGFRLGAVGRFVHLGHWDRPPACGREWSPGPQEFERAQRRLNDILVDMAELRDGLGVLDVGCGFGGTLESIAGQFRGMSLAGVNTDGRQLDICRQLAPGSGNRLEWRLADAAELPFAPGSFDRVLCIEAMFHFASRRDFFREAARVLRPGGALVVSDIVLTHSAARIPVPGFCIEAAIQDGYGPWPDFWSADAEHAVLGGAVGLRLSRTIDATENTRPSHRFTVSGDADPRRDPGDAATRAAMMLRWLHESGHLKYLYLRFDKPG